jgi:hypothetical protein
MDYQSQRSAIGRFLYSVTMKWTKWLCKHMWLWYVLNLTWGLIYTIIGAFMAIGIWIVTRAKPQKFYNVIKFEFGDNWGGLEGVFFIFVALNMGDEYTLKCSKHEFGHSFQNALFGPFNIFLTLIPSAVRYWYQRIREKKGKPNKDYDFIWFEGNATDGGIVACEYLDSKK